ncbi:hypothetical protein SPRG_20668 [Saprolegnia parasitica CBS 223.65]|uniref:MYND-type domain-containing protein n=1 Tax=Saprolegnia parasitica (strain CBS 223.65) TaxID=695850 RepID=A0A067C440_SAPPC|nr:hypothetical protein SPRG_20668 [Saprolegnia parasitica CBS 223.65]KDO25549.1 hypothetical protein SPRG_20668 [Saprolegnia parasitica CBS 223.65]|eukprot:XP_012203772.1 hypothetical protein SPRG_20668 [Saprolegnia parasitica CBS 223.65]
MQVVWSHVVADVVREHAGAGLTKVAYGHAKATTTWVPSHRAAKVLDSSPLADAPAVIVHTTASPIVGRVLAAAAPIAASDIAFSAQAFASVLSAAHVLTHCHACFATLRGRAVQCASCERARYCDRTCMQDHLLLHDAQCAALQALPATDNDLVRLALSCVIMELATNNASMLSTLVVHAVPSKERQRYERYAKLLLSHLPPLDRPRWLTLQHVLDVLLAVRFNAHPIVVDLHSSALGLGLFPDAAKMINHACRPTTYPRFNMATRALEFRALQSMAPGALLTYSYLDVFGFSLLEPRPARQQLLATTFGFDCVCGRCMSDNDIVSSDGSLTPCDKLLAELDDAMARQAWTTVVAVASQLLTEWTDRGLPDAYPLVYLLQTKLATAHMHLGAAKEAANATAAAATAATACGFEPAP